METENKKEDASNEDVTIEFIDYEKLKERNNKRKKALISQNKGKIISFFLACAYLLLGSISRGGEGFLKTILFLLLPMFLIWFSDSMGRHMGSSLGLGGSTLKRVDEITPASIVKFGGWLILLYPIYSTIFVVLFLNQ